MPNNNTSYIGQSARSNWIKLRTLSTVRWFAIAGQVLTLLVAWQLYDIAIPLHACIAAIGLSFLGNVAAITAYPDNRRLSEIETAFMLLFDIIQLCILLSLTGGLNNPFALLVLAPVTIAATVLPTRPTVLLGGAAVLLITLVSLFHLPLLTTAGRTLRMPDIFVFGFWVSIVTGITFIAIYTRRVTSEMSSMAEALLATQMALAREQKLTDLGGVVAATAHELGTPLATIKLVSSEMIDDLHGHDDLSADAKLIREQADRCRDILKSMGRAGKDDAHLRTSPIVALLEEAAEPHMDRGKSVIFISDISNPPIPLVFRKPEIIHGLRNLIQNAVDFSKQQVFIQITWSDNTINVQISDDGLGFSAHALNRIGDPFVNKRHTSAQSSRPGYAGMGLGLFIAKTLLERSGAKVTFSNGPKAVTGSTITPLRGAVVDVSWPSTKINAPRPTGLGNNPSFQS